MKMFFSRASSYGILTVIYLASVTDSGPRPIRTIAEGLDIPSAFLAKIVQTLPQKEKNQLHRAEMQGKSILKRLLSGTFSEDFIYRKKQGFAIPFDQWFFKDKENGKLFHSKLLNKNSRLHDFFNPSAIKELWLGYNKHDGNFNYFGVLWLLYVFSLWLEENPNVDFEN